MTFGTGEKKLVLRVFGLAQLSIIHDSTRSYHEAMGSTLVARNDTYEGKVGRTQFSPRGSRLGFIVEAPEIGGVQTMAVVSYGIGVQPNVPPATTEARYYDAPSLGFNQAYFSVHSNYIDVLGGLTYGLFGWQNYYYPCSVEYFPLPNQVFSRTVQVRLSRKFGATGPVGVEVAAAAMRPVQRDSEVPDANAGLRFMVNGWKGIGTPGSSLTTALPLSIGVSGVFRRFKLDAFTPPPSQRSNTANGWGVSVDGFLPIIPASDEFDRGNRLTLTGSFVTGTGIGDLINSRGGAKFPTLPNPALTQPPPEYVGNIDDGIVTFDMQGVLHTIDWRAFMVGFQYYLPPTGRLFITGNFTQAYSENMAELYPKGGTEVGLLTYVAHQSQYYDLNLFFDATPNMRVGASFQYTTVEYLDGQKPHNYREMLQGLYAF